MNNNKWLVVLSVYVGIGFLAFVFIFGLGRYFALDEFQYACATAMTASGLTPYLDFFEYHPPLSYLLHAPLFSWKWGSFSEMALGFRAISLSYIFAAYLFLGYYFYLKFKSGVLSIICPALSLCIGLSVLSLVEFRADNFSALSFLVGVLLLDLNRSQGTKKLAILSGTLFSAAFLFTQKSWVIGFLTLLVYLASDLFSRKSQSRIIINDRFGWLACSFLAPVAAVLVYLLSQKALGKAVELTVLEALRHEKYYPLVSAIPYTLNYWPVAGLTFLVILALALYALFVTKEALFLAPLLASMLSLFMTKAQYPHNFVFPGLFLGVLAAVGFAKLYVKRLGKSVALSAISIFFVGGIVVNQMSFVLGKTSNQHQLTLLDKIEEISRPGDRFIDNSGGAIFLRPANYHYLHGVAHRVMYREKFAKEFVGEYRSSAARFLITDPRYIPEVMSYIQDRYIHLDGSLYIYGKRLFTSNPKASKFEVLKDGEYYFFTKEEFEKLAHREGSLDGLVISGKKPLEKSMQLKKGTYQLTGDAGKALLFSSVPLRFFKKEVGVIPHSIINEY